MSDVMSGAAATVGKAVGGPIGAATKMISMAAPTIAGAAKPSGGGGFAFSPEEIDAIIKEWRNLSSDLKFDHTQASIMAQVQSPGAEFASADFAERANPSAEAFLQAYEKMMAYVNAYINALENAKQQISTQDEQAQEDIGKAGAMEV
ncbi:hypothetical protein [Saccharomonospora saliphila]|uniref:hypothetical protein n=1 Tax=Saccharomonospora saliphila TaxID=369829 RepID=UPI001E4EDA6D|nr:hypothetical protein [Saccharomonospora saliphila]